MMNLRQSAVLAALLVTTLSSAGQAQGASGCGNSLLRGDYVFSATGYTRADTTTAPWVPKAIVQQLAFNGDGTFTAPALTVVNPFGNLGQVLEPLGPSTGIYMVYENCTGTVNFADGVIYRIYLSPRGGNEFWAVQIAGPGGSVNRNVFQGKAERVR